MQGLHILAYFGGGAFLMNAAPHLLSGAMGRRFPSPFAKPPGRGQSSALVNLLWGFANLVLAYLLICRVGRFELENTVHAAAFAVGMLVLGVLHALHFGGLNEGRGPDLA